VTAGRTLDGVTGGALTDRMRRLRDMANGPIPEDGLAVVNRCN
jgi:hypothetical protein